MLRNFPAPRPRRGNKFSAMPFHQPDGIRYYTFDSLNDKNLVHAVFTRQGGLSPAPWSSLNVGGLRGDDPQRVYQNRVRSFELMDRDPESVYDVWQVHSTDVIWTTGRRTSSVRHRKADAILTDRPEVTLFMRFGDCVPILLHDPVRGVIGLAHAGWMGTASGIVREAITAMHSAYGCHPGDIQAAIGPSIAVHHYEVGREVVEKVENFFGILAEEFLVRDRGKNYFDLWKANRYQLEKMGVEQIEVSGICTACNLEDWFSHRGEQGKTGRFGVLMALRE